MKIKKDSLSVRKEIRSKGEFNCWMNSRWKQNWGLKREAEGRICGGIISDAGVATVAIWQFTKEWMNWNWNTWKDKYIDIVQSINDVQLSFVTGNGSYCDRLFPMNVLPLLFPLHILNFNNKKIVIPVVPTAMWNL